MYLKLIACILVVVSSSLIGFLCGENLRKRIFQLKEIEGGLYQLESEIMYTHTSLPDIFFNIGDKCREPIKNIFKEIASLLYGNMVDSVYDGFKKVFINNKDNLNLKKEDINIILNLSKSLGEADLEGQKNILNLTIYNLKKEIEISEFSMKKTVKMYRYLGFSFGAILVIMVL